MNCTICNSNINTTFLGKILGTYIKDKKSKKQAICFECQKKFPEKAVLLDQIKN